MSTPTHEIYFIADYDIVGTACYLKDGSISITLNNGCFAGIFAAFENWNPGGYAIRRIPKVMESDNYILDSELDDWLIELDQGYLDAIDNKDIDFDLDLDWKDDNGVIIRSNNIDDINKLTFQKVLRDLLEN